MSSILSGDVELITMYLCGVLVPGTGRGVSHCGLVMYNT